MPSRSGLFDREIELRFAGEGVERFVKLKLTRSCLFETDKGVTSDRGGSGSFGGGGGGVLMPEEAGSGSSRGGGGGGIKLERTGSGSGSSSGGGE